MIHWRTEAAGLRFAGAMESRAASIAPGLGECPGGQVQDMPTGWILIQGYRIVAGQSRDSMMAPVLDAARVAVIVTVATSASIFSQPLQSFFCRGRIHRWQCGHQNVERCPSETWRRVEPQERHGSPARP